MKQKIIEISLLGASACNLSCSFCYLGQNPFYQKYDKIVENAWRDGSYIDNLIKLLEILEADPKEVKEVDLWGGEPTLHIETVATQGKRLGSLFPNLEYFMIPNNFNLFDIDGLLDLIYALDETIAPRLLPEDNLNFHFQASIDGPPGVFNTYGHNVPWEQYKKNFDEIVDKLKLREPLKNITLDLAVCPCSSQKLILENLNTYEKIKEFKDYVVQATNYMNNRLKEISWLSFHVNTMYWIPRIAISQETTTEEAMEVNKILRLLDTVDYSEKYVFNERPGESEFWHNCSGTFLESSPNHECYESNENVITVMPDGTIAECPCSFFHNIPEFRNFYLEKKDYWEYKSCLLRKASFVNPLKDTDDEVAYHDWYVYGGGYIGTFSTYDCLNMNMALEMAASWQIDYSYFLNPEKLYNHYTGAFMTAECYRENVNVNHNPYIADINQFRRWFNGSTEYSYEMYKNRIQKAQDKELNYDNIVARYHFNQ